MSNVAVESIDALIKEYLVFRGFSSTLKSFEQAIKNDKNKSFKVERIVDNFSSYINTYNLDELKKYWTYFDKCFFSKLGHEAYKSIKKLESRLLRLYIVHAIQNNKPDKVSEFFEKNVYELQHDETWRDWFLIPFLKNPEQNKTYAICFTKVWQDSVLVSLGNCIDTVCSHLSLPKLLDFEKENQRLKRLTEENEKLKEQIMELSKHLNQERPQSLTSQTSYNTCNNSVAVQANENESFGDVMEMETDLLKNEKRNSTKGRFGWKLLGTKEKEPKPVKKESTSSNTFKRPSKLSSSPLSTESNLTTPTDEDSIAANLNKIQFKTDYYASSDLSQDDNKISDSGLTSSDLNSSMSSHDDGKTSDEAIDAPYTILRQNDFNEHTSPIVSCRFSENNSLIASLDLDGTFKVWQSLPTLSQASLFSHKADILCLDWIPKIEDKILLGKSTGYLTVHDINSRKVLWEASVHSKYRRVAKVVSNPTSASAVCSAVVPLNESKRLSLSSRLSNQSKLIKMKQYSSHNETGARQGIISEWDLQTGQHKNDLCLDPYPVYIQSMTYNHNGTLLVTGGADGMVRLFDIRNSDCLIGWHAHTAEILDVAFHPDETSIYSMGADGKVCVWDVNKVSSKIAEFPLQVGCTGIHHYSTTGGMETSVEDIPASKLFACDSSGQHMITCGPSGLMIYKITPKTTMDEAMHVLCPSAEVLTLDWMTSSPSLSTVMCGTKKGSIQVSTLERRR